MSSSTAQIQPPPQIALLPIGNKNTYSPFSRSRVPTSLAEDAHQNAMIAFQYGKYATAHSGQASRNYYDAVQALAFQYTQEAQQYVDIVDAAVAAGAVPDAYEVAMKAQRDADEVVADSIIASANPYCIHSHPKDIAHLSIRNSAFMHRLANATAVATQRHAANIAVIYANRAASCYDIANDHAFYAEAVGDTNFEAARLHVTAAAAAVSYAEAAYYVATTAAPIGYKLPADTVARQAAAAADPEGARRQSDAACAAYAEAAAAAYAATAVAYDADANANANASGDLSQIHRHTASAFSSARIATPLLLDIFSTRMED